MDLEGIVLNEIGQTEKDKYWFRKGKNVVKKQKQTNRYREQTGGYHKVRGRVKLVREIRVHTSNNKTQVCHKDVTYSIGNIGNRMIIIFYGDRW